MAIDPEDAAAAATEAVLAELLKVYENTKAEDVRPFARAVAEAARGQRIGETLYAAAIEAFAGSRENRGAAQQRRPSIGNLLIDNVMTSKLIGFSRHEIGDDAAKSLCSWHPFA